MISFIIPAHNEEFELPATLRTVREAADRVGCDYEIVVADDASTDATVAIAQAAGARVVSFQRRQIAAARNAGAQAARGDIFIFVDADTHLGEEHIRGVQQALAAGCAGGGALVAMDDETPSWGHRALKIFSAIYFRLGIGAGAFLFTTRENFLASSGFDERYFVGEEIYFSLALRQLGRFKILREPVTTSGRKLRLFKGRTLLWRSLVLILSGPRGTMSRKKLDLWYGREAREQV
ncbi:MAG: glycosyltransferase [Verrucomicrobiota bacterium]|nr:glycosyltransferase [Verrucomicrobiota bacterium]